MRGWYKKALASYYKSKGEERNVEDINVKATDFCPITDGIACP